MNSSLASRNDRLFVSTEKHQFFRCSCRLEDADEVNRKSSPVFRLSYFIRCYWGRKWQHTCQELLPTVQRCIHPKFCFLCPTSTICQMVIMDHYVGLKLTRSQSQSTRDWKGMLEWSSSGETSGPPRQTCPWRICRHSKNRIFDIWPPMLNSGNSSLPETGDFRGPLTLTGPQITRVQMSIRSKCLSSLMKQN